MRPAGHRRCTVAQPPRSRPGHPPPNPIHATFRYHAHLCKVELPLAVFAQDPCLQMLAGKSGESEGDGGGEGEASGTLPPAFDPRQTVLTADADGHHEIT